MLRLRMRSLWFMPLTFVAGQHGFLFFAPYLAFFLAGTHLIRIRQRRGRVAVDATPASPVVAVA